MTDSSTSNAGSNSKSSNQQLTYRQKERQRRLQAYFANTALNRSPFFGGKPPEPAQQEVTPGAQSKKEDPQHQAKKAGESEADKNKRPGKGLGELVKEQQEDAADEKKEKPPAARIVAYSDSEGEDEPFRLTRRRKKKKEGEAEQPELEEEKEDAPSTSAASGPSLQATKSNRRVLRAARLCTRRSVTLLKEEASWGLLLQIVLLWVFQRWRRKPAERFELLTLAISLPDALCSVFGWRCPSSRLPRGLQSLVQFTESWARPSALFQLEGLIYQAMPKKKRRRILTTISQSVRVFQEAELEAKSPDSRPAPRAQPRLAAESAALYKVELAEMKRILDAQGVKLPPERFDDTNAELLRFAASAGLLQAASPEEKAHAIQEGAQRVLKTLDWLKRHRCMPPALLKEWQHMVRWQGTDTEGWPILVIKIAKACAECQSDDAQAVSEAIIGQMQRAMTEVFSNQHGPDKVVVVMDAASANSLQAARNVNLFKQAAVTLNKHFPYRLQQLYLVELPPQLRWVLASLKPLLHPMTKEKIRTISITDPALPLPASVLQSPRFEGTDDPGRTGDANAEGSRSRRVSIPELPVSSSPPAPGAEPITRRGSIAGLPSAEGPRQRRRVRILELPAREYQPKTPSRASVDVGGRETGYSPGSILRPVLKRSTSVGLIGIKSNGEGEGSPAPMAAAVQRDGDASSLRHQE